MKKIGVWLGSPVFSHGQLYVSVSRVGDPRNITMAIKPVTGEAANCTRNVVFREVLLGCVSGAAQPPRAVPAQQSVLEDEIDPDWLDYDTIMEDVPHGDEEEFGAPQQRPVPPPRTFQPSLTPRIPRNAGALPSLEPDNPLPPPPLPRSEMSQYELYREENLRERDQWWFQRFGVQYPRLPDDL